MRSARLQKDAIAGACKYSIVVPAHNEERYLPETLRHLAALDHPAYEVIVVENGSTDATLRIARGFASRRIRVYSLRSRGVSRARNFGASKASKTSEWMLFLDADTLLARGFLRELDRFLSREGASYSIGTTRMLPIERSVRSLLWFRVYDLFHLAFRCSCSLQIARRDLFDKVRYDERLEILEDLKLIRTLQGYGEFFYMPTRSVSTSTRRFAKTGYVRLTLQWTLAALVPYAKRKKMRYEILR